MSNSITYGINDHVEYWVSRGDSLILVEGRVLALYENTPTSRVYLIKRDHSFQDNIGMYESDTVSHLSVLGLVNNS